MNKFKIINKSFLWLLNLCFLPNKIQQWLFGTGTRAIEICSACIMLGFAFVLANNNQHLLIIDPYEKFKHISPHFLSICMLIVAIAQITASFFKSARSNVLAGFILLIAALIWFVVFGLFMAAYPPASTAITTYLVLAIICALAGRALITHNRNFVDELYKGQ